MDKKQQQAVWQRVMDGPRSQEDGFDLFVPALTLNNAYRQLSGTLPGAKRLYEEQTDTVCCLKGLMRLAGRTVPSPRVPPMGQQSQEKLLIFCYRQSRQAAAEYLARSADPETGIVFRHLSDRQIAHCTMLATLLGKGKGQG